MGASEDRRTAYAFRVGDVHHIERLIRDLNDRQVAKGHTRGVAEDQNAEDQNRPRRKLFALVLAQPQAPYARDQIFPFIKHWHFRSGEHINFLFPGFASEALESFDDEAFNKVLRWVEDSLDGFRFSGRTMMVMFASNVRGKYAFSPIDRSAVIFTDIEELQRKGFIEEPRVFVEALISLAKANPGDDALWELRSEHVNSADGGNLFSVFLKTIKQTLDKYVHIPDDEIERSINVRRYFKVHDARRTIEA